MTTLRPCHAAPLWLYFFESLSSSHWQFHNGFLKTLLHSFSQFFSYLLLFSAHKHASLWLDSGLLGSQTLSRLLGTFCLYTVHTLCLVLKHSLLRTPICPHMLEPWHRTQHCNAHYYVSIGLYLGLHRCLHLFLHAGSQDTPFPGAPLL